jgi:hypothetical protein
MVGMWRLVIFFGRTLVIGPIRAWPLTSSDLGSISNCPKDLVSVGTASGRRSYQNVWP